MMQYCKQVEKGVIFQPSFILSFFIWVYSMYRRCLWKFFGLELPMPVFHIAVKTKRGYLLILVG